MVGDTGNVDINRCSRRSPYLKRAQGSLQLPQGRREPRGRPLAKTRRMIDGLVYNMIAWWLPDVWSLSFLGF